LLRVGLPPLPLAEGGILTGSRGHGIFMNPRSHSGRPAAPFAVVALALALAAVRSRAEVWTEDFSTSPALRGWKVSGNTNLFRWDADAGRLNVTWDTANPHSFFALPLGRTLTTADDFLADLTLHLTDIAGGVRASRPGAMPLSLGFLNLTGALSANYQRGAGRAKDLLEFTWFPAGEIPGFGAVDPTVSPITWDSAGKVAAAFTFPVAPMAGSTCRVRLEYRAADRTVTPSLLRGDQAWPLNPLKLPATFGSFALDAFAVMVWNEATSLSDSLLAHGWLDNIRLELPPAPIGRVALIGEGEVRCATLKGWRYTLEASGDLRNWSDVAFGSGTGAPLSLYDQRDAVFREQCYRVRADRE
jgi:hypothetical protein